MITTTPRRVAVLRRILAEATTVQTTNSTCANQAHLPPRPSHGRIDLVRLDPAASARSSLVPAAYSEY
jgi:hypothetical protein